MMALFGDHRAIMLLFFAGFFSNEVWRALGLVIGGKIDERAEILIWVRAVAAAILAGVIAQLLISPPRRTRNRADLRANCCGGYRLYRLSRRAEIGHCGRDHWRSHHHRR
jgi:hypothetical protein